MSAQPSLPIEPHAGSHCIVIGCNRSRGLLPYLVTTDGRVDRAWAQVAVCQEHREDLDEITDALLSEGVPREVVALHLVRYPDRTLMRAGAYEQLSFADLPTADEGWMDGLY